jgi:hypothetical protein
MKVNESKQLLWQHCFDYAQNRISTAQQAMESAQQSANEEGKSSAGDKYETGRAMMQIERDQAAQQLAEALKLKNSLTAISATQPATAASPGSMIVCDAVNFYIAISAGTCIVHEREVICLAPTAPVAKLLLGLKKGDVFTFNSVQHTINDVY